MAALQRPRRLLFNNDGNDAVHFPKHLEPTDENFWAQRSTPLLDSHVDSIFYCTNRGIGLVTHRSRVNEMLVKETREKAGPYADKRNIVADLHQRGTDPLKLMSEFCRRHDKELFWSMRMNDIHDALNGSMMSAFKKDHPEALFGTPREPPPYRGYSDLWGGDKGTVWGGYSGVDYGQAVVRELVHATVAEVLANYDLDGIELDFCRSPVLFKSHAWNRGVTEEEKAALTALVRQIRRTADSCGKPVLLAVHVPDSVDYCLSIGIDLETWLKEGLVDMLILGGDFLLNPWSQSVELGRRHGVKVYCSLTRAPTSANPGYGDRSALECYRGRALRAWDAGSDGLYLFNIFDPRAPLLREVGDVALMRQRSRIYYGNELPTWHARVSHAHGLQFRALPLLSPEHPQVLKANTSFTYTLSLPEPRAAHQQERQNVFLGLRVKAGNAKDLQVSFNEGVLTAGKPKRTPGVRHSVPLRAPVR
jgi:hypothetical protein